MFLHLALETKPQIGSFIISPVNYKENVLARKEARSIKTYTLVILCADKHQSFRKL